MLVADVALRDGSTVYERYGDTPILLIAAIALILGRLLDMTEPSAADRSPGAAAARANWWRLRHAGVSGGPAGAAARPAAARRAAVGLMAAARPAFVARNHGSGTRAGDMTPGRSFPPHLIIFRRVHIECYRLSVPCMS